MKHPSDELIISYLYNEAETKEIRWIESHTAECGDCASKIDAMKKTINALNGLKDEEPPIFLADKIAAGFEHDASNEKSNAFEIMTPGELAEFLKIPVAGIYDLLSDIPYLTLAGQIRFRRSSVEKWLEIREKNPVTPKAATRDLEDSPKLWRNVV